MRVLVLVSAITGFVAIFSAACAHATEFDLFGGFETKGRTLGISAGFKLAAPPTGDRPAFVVMGLADGTAAFARAPPAQGGFWYAPHGEIAGSLLLGARWAVPGGRVTAVVGPGVVRKQEADPTGAPRWLRARIGPVALAEIWAHPRPDLLLDATLVASAPARSLWARAALGIEVREGAFVGPEATLFADAGYREVRLGAHLTGARIGPLWLRLSAGAIVHERCCAPYLAVVVSRRL